MTINNDLYESTTTISNKIITMWPKSLGQIFFKVRQMLIIKLLQTVNSFIISKRKRSESLKNVFLFKDFQT